MSWWLAVGLGLWLALFVADNLLTLPAGIRLPLALGGAVVTAVGFVTRVARALASRPGLAHTAVALERRYGIRDNVLINACDFEGRTLAPEETWFARETGRASVRAAARIPAADLWEPRRLLRWGAAAAVLVAAWLAYVAVFPRQAANAWLRYAVPLRDVPPAGSVIIAIEPAADLTVGEGDDLTVVATCRAVGPARAPTEPPAIAWAEHRRSVDPGAPPAARAAMRRASDAADGRFAYTFPNVRRPFAFRVFAADTYSRSIRVDVSPAPRIRESRFLVTPPAYTALGTRTNAGPPAAVAAMAGSRLEVDIGVEPAPARLVWHEAGRSQPFAPGAPGFRASTVVTSAFPYEIRAEVPGRAAQALARGDVTLEPDHPPAVEFETDDRNRLVAPGATVPLDVVASDDFGLRAVAVMVREAEQTDGSHAAREWPYLGPPGPPGPVRESHALVLDPARFQPGRTYLVEAAARDFCPNNRVTTSRPIVLRIKTPAELALATNDALASAFAYLRLAVASQEKAGRLSDNLRVNLEEALARTNLVAHRRVMATEQEMARANGDRARVDFRRSADGAAYASRLDALVGGEMPLVTADIGRLEGRASAVSPRLAAIERRQAYILSELLALLGRIADERRPASAKPAEVAAKDETPIPTAEAARALKDAVEDFADEQRRIIERSRTLMDQAPEDLTAGEEQILGELAREESKWAAFLEEQLTDFSKLPQQDFADGSIAKELNEVLQEVKLASKSLYEKKVELAVPHEQSGLENAEELVNNLERWLPDTPDHEKWLMEEPLAPADVALADLPSELEDIVGELLDKEEEMSEDVEDVTSSWMDSMDKGAGWDAADGPISSMSAKGVTGNRLPNEMEIGGRSGEGRTGRSSGQMVEETAEGKKGRETPTRLTPSPFEPGSIKDASTESPGGATGGGKISGYAGEGLRGPTPPAMQQKMKRLANQQAAIRQEAEALALKLRAYHLPTGDLEASAHAMSALERHAQAASASGIRQSYSRAVDALKTAREAVRAETGLHREHSRLPDWMRSEISVGLQDGVPPGYEEMASEYFRQLSQETAP